jgi:hypothetical protein
MSDLGDDDLHHEPPGLPPDTNRLREIYRQIDEARAEYLRKVAPLLEEIGAPGGNLRD